MDGGIEETLWKKDEDPLDQYEVIETLGDGAFGIIYKVKSKKNGEFFAAKVCDAQGMIEEVTNELRFIKSCNHPNIIRAFEAYIHKNKIWLILECCEVGSIFDIMDVLERDLTEEEISFIIQDTLGALYYLHHLKPPKIHRDIKCANILLSDKGQVLLTDFGVSAEINPDSRKQITGSSYWMAPEIIRGRTNDEKADIWSLGITCIEMAEKRPPLSEKNPLKAMYMISRIPPSTLTHPGKYSEDFSDFIKTCLVKEPKIRPSIHNLLRHKFVFKNFTKKKRKETVLKALVKDVRDVFKKFGGRKGFFEDKAHKRKKKLEEVGEGNSEDDDEEDDMDWNESSEESSDGEISSDNEDYDKSKIFYRQPFNKKALEEEKEEEIVEDDNYLNIRETDEIIEVDGDVFAIDDGEKKIGKLELTKSKANLFENMASKLGSKKHQNVRKRNIPSARKPPVPSKKTRPHGHQKKMRRSGMSGKKTNRLFVLKPIISNFHYFIGILEALQWFVFGCCWIFGSCTFLGFEESSKIFVRFCGLYHIVMCAVSLLAAFDQRKLLSYCILRTVVVLSMFGVLLLSDEIVVLQSLWGNSSITKVESKGFLKDYLESVIGKGGNSSGSKLYFWIFFASFTGNLLLCGLFWIKYFLGMSRVKKIVR